MEQHTRRLSLIHSFILSEEIHWASALRRSTFQWRIASCSPSLSSMSSANPPQSQFAPAHRHCMWLHNSHIIDPLIRAELMNLFFSLIVKPCLGWWWSCVCPNLITNEISAERRSASRPGQTRRNESAIQFFDCLLLTDNDIQRGRSDRERIVDRWGG